MTTSKSKPRAKTAKDAKEKRPTGRPTLYKPEYDDLARKFCLLGATDEDLARMFEVNLDTIYEWKKVHASFSDAIKRGKDQADANVADRLYQRAMGYSHEAVKIFANPTTGAEQIVPFTEHYAPDTTAAIFWLKNRQPKQWRDKQDLEHSGPNGGPITYKNAKDMSDDELAAIAARSSARAAD